MSLEDKEQKIILFLLTNDKMPVLPAYQIAKTEIAFYCGTTVQKVEDVHPKIKSFGIHSVQDDWYVIEEKFTRAVYTGGKTEKARERVWNNFPPFIKKIIDLDGFIAQSLLNDSHSSELPTASINHISYTRNQKPETINHKTEIEKLIEIFNSLTGKNTKSYKSFFENFKTWRKEYSFSQIESAVRSASDHGWIWKSHDGSPVDWNLELLLRTRNRTGECDYIARLIDPTYKGAGKKSVSSNLDL
jgi:hypothetical protein